MNVNSSKYSVLRVCQKVFARREILLDSIDHRQLYNLLESTLVLETIIMGIPLPPFYLIERRDGSREVLDGIKRLTAILDFIDDKFPLSGMRFYTQFEGLFFSQLPPIVRAHIEDYELLMHTFLPPVSSDFLSEMYSRLNK